MHTVQYISFLPGGNKTALVIGDGYGAAERKLINGAIMEQDPEIEQVGFVKALTGPDCPPSLQMAGGEFCGNATRSAAYYYLGGRPGELTMTVSGGEKVSCGVCENGDAWCEIPLGTGDPDTGKQIETVAPGITQVSLAGITHLVVEPETSAPFLQEAANSEDPEKLKIAGLQLIEKYGLMELEAAGVIFQEYLPGGRLKINPIVRVRDIESLFYETACGSGTVAAAMVLARKENTDMSSEMMQPSGMTIGVRITLSQTESSGERSSKVSRAIISGQVKTDLKPNSIEY